MVERKNFHRFCGILLDTGANVLREVFLDKYVGTSTLLRYFALHKNYLNLLQPITIRKDQFELLYPPVGGAPVIKDIDITLLCVLFRNLDTQTTPYDSVWIDPKTHLTYQADVTRIRLARNALTGLVSSASMCNTTYNNEVSNLTTIYHRLVQSLPAGKMSSTELQEMIDRELYGPLQKSLDRKVEGLEKTLLEWYQHDEDFRKAVMANKEENRKIIKELSENQEDMTKDIKCLQDRLYDMSRQRDSLSRENKDVNLDAMKKQIALSKVELTKHSVHADEFFIETQQYRTGKTILDLHGQILITGNPGQGKTYLAYQLLLEVLKDKKSASPLIILSADEWIKLADSSTELVILVDDMCGKYGLLQGDLKLWNENARFITTLIDNRKHTVIYTMRTHIHAAISEGLKLATDLFDPQCLKNITLNMENDILKLREADKIDLASRYLKEYDLTENEILLVCKIDQISIGFPLLCRTAGRIHDKSKLFDLFKRPLEIMLSELQRLRTDNSVSYGSLVLVMLAGGQLALESIDEYTVTSMRTKEVKLIFDTCGVPDAKLLDIRLAADALCKTYLCFNERDEIYSFVHDTTEEATFLSYGKLHLLETLKLCSLRSLCKLCKINNESRGSDTEASAFMIVLQPHYYAILIERFIKALETKCSRDFATIVEANVWSSDQFRKLFMNNCHDIHVLADTDKNSLLVHAANANNCVLAIELLRDMKQIRTENEQQDVSYLTKAVKASCVHKDLYLFKRFMETSDVNGNEILSLTVEKGSEEAMEFLLQNGADVNYRSQNGESLLHIACLHGRLHMVILLQSKYSQSVNYCDRKGRSVCHSAASGGNVEILNFLVKNGADPFSKDVDGRNLLHNACFEGKKEMAFYLMDKYSTMYCNLGKEGFTVLHCVAYGGSIAILNRVCELINNPTRTDYNSRLNVSSRQASGFLKVIFNSFWKLINVYSQADSNKHLDYNCHAEEKGALHGKLADLNSRTETEETLLHMACLSGKLEMTKHLVENFPDMISAVDNHNGTPAHYAAQSSNVLVLQYLIEKGLDPLSRTATQETLLHKSSLAGQLEMTKYLAEKHPDMIHEVDICKETIAHYAAKSSNVSVLKYLIDQHLDPWCRTDTQQTLLHKSCIMGQLQMTQYLFRKYPDMINAVDNCKETPAHCASQSSNVSVLSYLIDEGVDPWCRTVTKETLLHKSCFAGQLEMSQYLHQKYPTMIKAVDNCKGTPAHYAAASGNVSILRYFIDQGFDPSCRTAKKETLLHRSCLAGQLEMTKYLVETYPDMINKVNDSNETPAHYAAQSSNVSVLQYLIDQGQDPLCKSARKETLLHKSCIKGQLKLTQYLCEKYPNMINTVDNCKATPAHCAAESGKVSLLQYLINEGINPWCTTNTRQTLLHMSCLNGRLEMTKYLVETYPDMMKELDNCKRTPVHCAAQSGNVSILQYLIDQHLDPQSRTAEQYTLLHMSCRAGQLETTKYLVENYPDMINEVDNCKETPTYYAVESGNVSILKYLIDEFLDPWCRTATQETLLHRSCIAGQLEMSKFLVENYPDMIREIDSYERTPAHSAAESGNVPVLEYVIGQGLEPYCRTSKQQILLHISCNKGRLEMTQYLVEKYPDMIYAVDNSENTPVHYAAMGGNISVLQYLIGLGVDPCCIKSSKQTLLHMACTQLEMTKYLVETYPDMIHGLDNCKRTPAHHAAMEGNISVLEYLICQGLNPWCRTSTQETLLHMACHMGQLEMTRYLVEKYRDMIKTVDDCNRTPAHSAAVSGNVSLLLYLTNEGINPWCETNARQTLLHVSCLNGRLEMTKYLVKKYPDMVKLVDNCKSTPAYYAAQSSNVSVLQYLIDQDLDPYSTTAEQYTLLHKSCLAGQLEMTKYLVENYPDMINEVDSFAFTPIQCAALGGSVSVLQYLIGKGVDPWRRTPTRHTLLDLSCIKGQLEMIQFLVEKYPDMIHELASCNKGAEHHVAESGNVSVLQYLIEQGFDPRCKTAIRETLLHSACLCGQLEMTKYLVETYPDMINEVDNHKQTPAHYAAQSSNVSVLQYIIGQGQDPWCVTTRQETLLHKSCMCGLLEITQYLHEEYPDMIKAVDIRKETPGHYAATSSNVLVLQYLIDQGFDPWCRTGTQATLLHISCLAGQLEMTKYLVKKYPDMINEVDNNKQTPAHYAVQYVQVKHLDMFHEFDIINRTLTYDADASANVPVLEYLISQGLNPYCRTSKQETLLHLSSLKGKLEMTCYLVKKYPGMINMVDNLENTPGHYAAKGGNVPALQFLIGRGVDPWFRNRTQETLLHKSSIAGKIEMTRYLVETYHGMIKVTDNIKRTPAHAAAESGNVSLLQYLINEGIDPKCTTNEEHTLLHMSCINGRLEMTQYLVKEYPDMMQMSDVLNNKPAYYAAQSNNASVLRYLNDLGLFP